MTHSKILGVGHYLPQTCVTSAEIEERLSLPPGWIEQRTGIRERRYAAGHEAVTDLAIQATQQAIQQAGIDAQDAGLILLATSTPDHLLPPSAPLLAHKAGCTNAGAMDVAGACTGFVYCLALADSYVRIHKTSAIVVAANILSRRINPEDRATCSIFADAAGAVVLNASGENEECGLLAVELGNQGAYYDLIKVESGGSRKPFTSSSASASATIALANGREAYAVAINSMVRTSMQALQKASLSVEEIDWWIPHQANGRLLDAVRKELGIPKAKLLTSYEACGNSSAATIPLTLSLHQREGHIQKGQTLLMTAAGAGFTEGAIVYRY